MNFAGRSLDLLKRLHGLFQGSFKLFQASLAIDGHRQSSATVVFVFYGSLRVERQRQDAGSTLVICRKLHLKDGSGKGLLTHSTRVRKMHCWTRISCILVVTIWC